MLRYFGLIAAFSLCCGLRPVSGAPEKDGIVYSYALAKEANVTLGIYDAEGHLLRTLIKNARRRKGSNSEVWDGKDQFGNLVAAGEYEVRGIEHPPITVQPMVSVGNPGTPPWPTADGRGDWLSDEAAPQGAATDGTNVYLAAPGSEKGHSIIAVGRDGERIWGYSAAAAYPRCVSLALGGQYLYALFSGPEGEGPKQIGRAFVICLDKNSGAPAQFSRQKPEFRVATWPYVDRVAGLWDLRVNQTFAPANYGGQTRYFANDVGEPTDAVGIAAVGGRLYISMLSQNQILVFDAATAQQIDTIPIAQPVGLHALSNGQLLGVSAGKIVTINPATKNVTTFIDHDLVAPHDVTTDKNDFVYVSDWGTSFQVKAFDVRGKYLRAIGKAGGRAWRGDWQANGMLLPRGIAVTDEGKLWVAEDDAAPNRVSVWNATNGKYLHDYLGPAPYGGGGHVWADPTDAATIVAGGVLYRVDRTKKTWTPVSTPYRRMSRDEAFTPNAMNGIPGARTVTHNGQQFIYVSQGNYGLVIFRREGNLLKTVGLAGCLGRFITDNGTGLAIWDSDVGRHMIANYYPGFFAGHIGDNYIWSDRNGDEKVQADEMQWARTLSRGDEYKAGMQPEWTVSWGFGVANDGAIFLSGFCKDRNVTSRLDVDWRPNGAPHYDLGAAKVVVLGSAKEGVQGLFVDSRNHLLITRPYEWNPSQTALDCYDRDGKLLWSLAAPVQRQQADDFLADNIAGEFHTPNGELILASWLWHANYKPYLLTADGLFVSSLLDETRLGPASTWDESYKHYFQAPDGSAYIVNGANDAYHIDKIIGLDQIRRFKGTISASAAALQVAAAPATSVTAAPAPPILRASWSQKALAIDGQLDEWKMGSGVVLMGSNHRSVRVALARDASNLYLAYEVQGAQLVNKGGNWQTLFISGAAVDLMLHAGQFQDHFAPAVGDQRLLMSVYQGQPIAVLYRPVVPGNPTPTRLMGATIDQIIKLDKAQIVVSRNGDGYAIEAAIPLAELNLDPKTDSLRGDVGVIYADETGANRALRLYYYNHDTSMTADLTTEATLQPGNWGEIELARGPNLVQNGDFEVPLSDNIDAGWNMSNARNGASASISAQGALSGAHALLLQQTVPVQYAPEAYNLADYDAFIKSANGGTGGGYVAVEQRVPVVGGKKYSLRFHLRTLDFPGGENKNPGPNRGYVSLQCWLRWEGDEGGVWALNHQDTMPQWKTLTDARFNYYGVPLPYTAPPGATSVVIQFGLSTNFAGKLPQAFLDDVELVEVP